MSQTEEDKILSEINFGDGEPAPDDEPSVDEQEPSSDDETGPIYDEQAGDDTSPAPEQSVEEKASAIGWRPKAEWKGHPDKWVSAEEYLKRGEEIMPILKADREKLFGQVKELEQRVSDVMKYHKDDRARIEARAKAEYEQKLAELKAQTKEAVDRGDTEEWEKLEAKREALRATAPIQATEQAVGTVPQGPDQKLFEEWRKENDWYKIGGKTGHEPLDDTTKAAQAIAFRVHAENPHMTGWEKEFLDKVTERVKLAYPERFQNVRRSRSAPSVEAGGSTPGGRAGAEKKYTAADLPREAREELAAMKRAGMSEKEFIAEYFGLSGGISFNE